MYPRSIKQAKLLISMEQPITLTIDGLSNTVSAGYSQSDQYFIYSHLDFSVGLSPANQVTEWQVRPATAVLLQANSTIQYTYSAHFFES